MYENICYRLLVAKALIPNRQPVTYPLNPESRLFEYLRVTAADKTPLETRKSFTENGIVHFDDGSTMPASEYNKNKYPDTSNTNSEIDPNLTLQNQGGTTFEERDDPTDPNLGSEVDSDQMLSQTNDSRNVVGHVALEHDTMPSVGDIVHIKTDHITDKAPCNGPVTWVNGGKVHLHIDNEPHVLDWQKAKQDYDIKKHDLHWEISLGEKTPSGEKILHRTAVASIIDQVLSEFLYTDDFQLGPFGAEPMTDQHEIAGGPLDNVQFNAKEIEDNLDNNPNRAKSAVGEKPDDDWALQFRSTQHHASVEPIVGVYCAVRFAGDTIANLSKLVKSLDLYERTPFGDFHTTTTYSTKPVPYIAAGVIDVIIPYTTFKYELFGPNHDTLVLTFKSQKLQELHGKARTLGASWDYPSYIPHVTLGKVIPPFDVSTLPLPKFNLHITDEYSTPLHTDHAERKAHTASLNTFTESFNYLLSIKAFARELIREANNV
jgi:hypothetical protein